MYRRLVRFGAASINLIIHGGPAPAVWDRALPSVLASARPAADGDEAAFEIHLIDAAASGAARPRLAWQPRDFGPNRLVPGWSDEGISVLYLRSQDGLAVIDWPGRRAVVWVPDMRDVPVHERAAPLRWLFDLLAVRAGMLLVHAAVVGLDGEGVLIAGPARSGKSTLALTCAARGWSYIGDDYCLLETPPRMRGHALYATGKVRDSAAVQPAGIESVPPGDVEHRDGVTIVFLADWGETPLVQTLPLRAIVLPEFADEHEARLETAPPHLAFRRLAPGTLAQSEADGRPIADGLAAIARDLPAYRLLMPPNPAACADSLRGLFCQPSTSGRTWL